jgi:hypothetical protein
MSYDSTFGQQQRWTRTWMPFMFYHVGISNHKKQTTNTMKTRRTFQLLSQPSNAHLNGFSVSSDLSATCASLQCWRSSPEVEYPSTRIQRGTLQP